MTHYRVKWVIDVDEETPEKAVQRAYKLMHGRDSTAVNFDVYDAENKYVESIDLLDTYRTPDGW